MNQFFGRGGIKFNMVGKLGIFKYYKFTAGVGANSSEGQFQGGDYYSGGGGGGVVMNGDTRVKGSDGTCPSGCATGGVGYGGVGAGGGGDWDKGTNSMRFGGFRGANGLVYIEW